MQRAHVRESGRGPRDTSAESGEARGGARAEPAGVRRLQRAQVSGGGQRAQAGEAGQPRDGQSRGRGSLRRERAERLQALRLRLRRVLQGEVPAQRAQRGKGPLRGGAALGLGRDPTPRRAVAGALARAGRLGDARR